MHSNSRRTRLSEMALVIVVCCLVPAPRLVAQERGAHSPGWPQFLGPQRNGISAETALMDEWGAGPQEVWRIAGGVGMSGLAVKDRGVITLVQRDRKQIALAVDALTGKKKWETPIAAEYRNQMGNGPRATPTITEEAVYALTGEGILVALSFANGQVIWQQDLLSQTGGKPADYGMSCSPLVDGERVFVTIGAQRATVVAVDTLSGKTLWTAGSDPAGYSSPAIFQIAGAPQLIVFSGSSLLGLAPDTGKELWRYEFVTDFDCNIATPILVNDRLFISSGENHGSVLLAVERKDTGEYQVSEVWTSLGARSVLRNEWQTSILWDGYLYGFDNVGSAGPVTHLTCVDAKTGRRAWRETRFGKGNLIAADGKLFMSTMKGELVIVQINSKQFDEIGRMEVLGTTRQAPALSNGLLYLRDDSEIVCLDVRQR